MHVFACDLSVPGAAQELYDAVRDANLTIDMLINNAGFGLNGKFHANPAQQEFALLQVNVVALAQLTRLVLPGMVARGLRARAEHRLYRRIPARAAHGRLFCLKAYVLSLSEALAEELKDSGVSVTVLCPGPTQTEFIDRAGMEESLLFRLTKQSATKVASIGYKAMLKGEAVVVPGLHNWAVAQTVRFAPRSMARSLAGYLVK